MAEDTGSGDTQQQQAGTDGGSAEGQQHGDRGGDAKSFTQEQVNALLADQKRKVQASYKDYDALKTKAQQFDVLEAASQTDVERASREAREAAARETSSAYVPRLVRAEFKAAAKGVLSADQLKALLEDLDLTRYATDDGEADEARIAQKVAAFAPKEDARQPFPDLGGGKRGGTAKATSMNDIIRQQAGYSG